MNGNWVFLNGEFVAAQAARISPFDRGFLFAHAAYEVTAVYGGRAIDLVRHVDRLQRTLAGLDLPDPLGRDGWLRVHGEVQARNGLNEGLIYLQVTGGAYDGRDFAGPQRLEPGVFMFTSAKQLITEAARTGIAAITLEDTRWARRDLKTTQLLSQALAYRRARDAGAATAIMHEDGLITEAASANAWIVTAGGEVMTRDLSAAILPGITRVAIVEYLAASGARVVERAFDLETLRTAREVFTSSAGALVLPVVTLDGEPVGTGHPGPMTRQVQALYYTAIGADLGEAAPWL